MYSRRYRKRYNKSHRYKKRRARKQTRRRRPKRRRQRGGTAVGAVANNDAEAREIVSNMSDRDIRNAVAMAYPGEMPPPVAGEQALRNAFNDALVARIHNTLQNHITRRY